MPDAAGNFKGISVPAFPWERSKLSVSEVSGASGKRNSQVGEAQPNTKAWKEACQAATLREFQQETRWAGTD